MTLLPTISLIELPHYRVCSTNGNPRQICHVYLVTFFANFRKRSLFLEEWRTQGKQISTVTRIGLSSIYSPRFPSPCCFSTRETDNYILYSSHVEFDIPSKHHANVLSLLILESPPQTTKIYFPSMLRETLM